jgi:hypothetical protein
MLLALKLRSFSNRSDAVKYRGVEFINLINGRLLPRLD